MNKFHNCPAIRLLHFTAKGFLQQLRLRDTSTATEFNGRTGIMNDQ